MNRKNTIGMVATIKKKPRLILDAQDACDRVYETEIIRKRQKAEIFDTFILRYSGKSAGSEEVLRKLAEGVEVLIAGEIRTENKYKPAASENSVTIFIFAEVIAVNEPPAEQQNEVKICGRICKIPRTRETYAKKGKPNTVTSMIVAVNVASGAHFIPCVCFGKISKVAAGLPVGTCVEITGRMQSREFKKRVKGNDVPFLCVAHEVSITRLTYKKEKV